MVNDLIRRPPPGGSLEPATVADQRLADSCAPCNGGSRTRADVRRAVQDVRRRTAENYLRDKTGTCLGGHLASVAHMSRACSLMREQEMVSG